MNRLENKSYTLSAPLWKHSEYSQSKEDKFSECGVLRETIDKLEEKVMTESLSTDEEMSTLEGEGLHFDVYLYGRHIRMDLSGVLEL